MKARKLYRPSNGSEGERFFSRYCYQCKHDKNMEDPCDIIILTMSYDLSAKEYPYEWLIEDNKPKCTKFEKKDRRKGNENR